MGIQIPAAVTCLWLAASGLSAAGDDVTFVLLQAGTGERVTRAEAWLLPAHVSLPVRSDGTLVARPTDLAIPGCRLQVIAQGFEARTIPCSTGASPTELHLTPTRLRTHEEVTVSARRVETAAFEQPASTAVVNGDELAARLPRTTPEALMQTPGVWVQKTNHGGGAPFVRGLVGNQVLVLVDGIRLNNATVRYGPNQYLATIDPGQIERIEVVRGGSGSVLYGSDALGGVIHIVTRRPRFSPAGVTVDVGASGRIVSADMERSGRVEVAVTAPRVGILGGVAARDYGDLRAGGGLGVEAPSGYRETNGDVTLMAQIAQGTRLTASYQHVHQFDVPRFDQVAQRGFARYSFDPQVRQLAAVGVQHQSDHALARSVTVTGSWHRSFERRQRQTRGSPIAIAEEDRVTTMGLTAQAQSAAWRGWSVRYGGDLHLDAVRSSRADRHVVTGDTQARRGLYPDRAQSQAAGAFAVAHLEVRRLAIDLGTRFTRTRLEASDAVFGTVRPDSQATVGSVAAAFALTPEVRLFGSVAQGFRAPNLDDVSTLGLFDSGIEVPAPQLRPERSVAYEAGVKWRAARTAAAVSVWRTQLSDLIDRVRARVDGLDVLDGQRVYQRQNVGDASVRGIEIEIERVVAGPVSAFAWSASTFGQQTTAGQPMRRIPPFNGAAGLRWVTPRVSSELAWRAAARQDRLAQGDRDDHRMNPAGTPGWATIGLTIAYRLTPAVRVVGGADNLFDRGYRVHGSGIDGYGRHAWVGLHLASGGAGSIVRR